MIYVAIIEDDAELCAGYVEMLGKAADISCCCTFNNCEKAIATISEEPVDVVLMDINLPGMTGIEGTREIKNLIAEVDIIMLTVHDDAESIFKSLKAGACGYLVKSVEPDRLINAVREVYNGGSPMSMRIARKVLESFRQIQPVLPLTKREKEVAEKISEGKSNKVIAKELYVEESTIKFHCKNIYKKLHANGRIDLMRKLNQWNLE